ncbi:MAG: DUF2207 family protein [Acidimicrobiia bacterium]
MEGLRRGFRIVGTTFFVVVLIGAILAGKLLIPKKEFSLPRVAVDATLDTDGTLRVVEHITYDFTGHFHFGTRPIPVGAYEITDMSVSEHGRPLVSGGAPYNLIWYFDATDETRTFDIAYTVRNATVAGADVAALYWKWVGEDHPTIGDVTATLHVPPGSGTVRAWGHGPLTGVVRIHADTVTFRAPDVPRGTFVEGRVTVPAARLPQLPAGGTAQLPRILAEERAWARSANAQRARDAEIAHRDQQIRDALTVAAPILTLLGVLVFLWLWRRYGKEPPVDPPVGEYVRDLPDDPPAVVASLVHWGADRPEALSATVLDLARRGHLAIKEIREERALLPDRTDYELTAAAAPPADELEEYERTALDLVFDGRSTVLHSEIAKHAREHQSESLAKWTSFKRGVQSSLRGRKYINGRRSKPFFLNVITAVVIGLVGGGAIAHGEWVVGAIALAWAAVQIALTPLLRQRTPEGQQRFHQWRGVRNYLRDFSQLADAPAGHLVLWEQYLVYAVALGVSEQLAAGLAAKLPPEEQPRFAPWYVGYHPGVASFGSIGDFASGLGHTTSAFTPASSGSGGGGGFSGGGGGGGGGGGIGAG